MFVSTDIIMKSTRRYTMTARARAVEATRAAIVEALRTLSEERLLRDIGLEDVAQRAGVSVQTVLRHFGSRAELFEQVATEIRGAVVEERRAPVGDVAAAMRVLLDHYESRGDAVLLLLAQERLEETVARITESGRAVHRAWVEEVFAPFLPVAGEAREEAVDLLVAATDLYTWKLLRRDRGHSLARTRQRMELLVRAVLTGLGEIREER